MECIIAHASVFAHVNVWSHTSQCTHSTHKLTFILFFSFSSYAYRNQGAKLDLEKIERGLQLIKKGTLPTTPETIEEINEAFAKDAVFDAYGSTLQTVDINGNDLQKKHIFFDGAVENKTKQFAFCVFSSKTTVQLIEKHIPPAKRHVLMDATFRVVPVGKFNQLFILYIRKNKKVCMEIVINQFQLYANYFITYIAFFPFQVFPFAWILMDRKTQAAYEAVFKFIDANILPLGDVASFTSDFERAMRNALKRLYPSIKRFTCHFHYTQALKRRASQTHGLVEAIRSDEQCRYK